MHVGETNEKSPIHDEEETSKSGVSFGIVPAFFAEIELFLRITESWFEEVGALIDVTDQLQVSVYVMHVGDIVQDLVGSQDERRERTFGMR